MGKRVMALRSIILSVIILALLIVVLVVNTLWLDLLSEKACLWVAIIGIVVIILYLLIGSIIIPRYQFLIFKYNLSDEEIVVRKGLWFITTTKIPLFRIQNVEIQEGIIMRKYNLANVNLSTAGGNTEVILISKQEANIIKQFIRDNKQKTL
ncbi:PH domain-containing protein [Staphylococcus kloosii]|nr:PH domain-containing protein [Staphylococcus kloosii]